MIHAHPVPRAAEVCDKWQAFCRCPETCCAACGHSWPEHARPQPEPRPPYCVCVPHDPYPHEMCSVQGDARLPAPQPEPEARVLPIDSESIDDWTCCFCNKKAKAYTLCQEHYERAKPPAPAPSPRALALALLDVRTILCANCGHRIARHNRYEDHDECNEGVCQCDEIRWPSERRRTPEPAGGSRHGDSCECAGCAFWKKRGHHEGKGGCFYADPPRAGEPAGHVHCLTWEQCVEREGAIAAGFECRRLLEIEHKACHLDFCNEDPECHICAAIAEFDKVERGGGREAGR